MLPCEIKRSPGSQNSACWLALGHRDTKRSFSPTSTHSMRNNAFTQTTSSSSSSSSSQLLSCLLVLPQPAHLSDSTRVHRGRSPAPSGVAAPGVCQSQVLGILCRRGHKPVHMPRNSPVPVQSFRAVGHRSSGSGQKVQVVGVVERRRGGACAGVGGDQVFRVLHAVARAQAIGEASFYPGAFARECAGSLWDPGPGVLDFLIDVL